MKIHHSVTTAGLLEQQIGFKNNLIKFFVNLIQYSDFEKNHPKQFVFILPLVLLILYFESLPAFNNHDPEKLEYVTLLGTTHEYFYTKFLILS